MATPDGYHTSLTDTPKTTTRPGHPELGLDQGDTTHPRNTPKNNDRSSRPANIFTLRTSPKNPQAPPPSSGRDEPERYLKGSWDLLLPVIEGEKVDDFVMIVRYIEKVVPAEHQTKVEAFMQEHLSESKYGEFVSIADARLARGRLEGHIHRVQKLLRMKFEQELPAEVLERLNRADEADLDEWMERALSAERLEDVFQ